MSLIDERLLYFDPATISLRGYYQCHELTIPGVQMLGKFDHRTAREPLPPHCHEDRMEVSFLVKGRQSYRVHGQVYRMRGGDQFVTFPDEWHDTANTPEEKATLYWFIFQTKNLCKDWLYLSPRAASALAKKLNALPGRHFRAHPQSQGTLEHIFQLMRNRATPARNIEVANLLAYYLFQTVEAAKGGTIPTVSPQIQSVLDSIGRQRNDEWIHLPALAEECGLSVPRFKARFRCEMGVPPGEYMMRRKLEMAKQRLVTSKAHVTDIAHDLGFSSSQYFATVFRKYERQTPSEFLGSLI